MRNEPMRATAPTTEPRVTVIVPVYNGADLIGRALDSVFAQTLQDFAIIISDDGSTDGTREAVAPYLADPRVEYFWEENGGLSAARNRAIRRCRTEYMVMLDADDTLPPNSLQRHVEVADREGAEWLNCDVRRICGGEERIASGFLPKDEALDYAMRRGGVANAFFYTRAAVHSVGLYREERDLLEDRDLDIRLLLAGIPYGYIPEPLYEYWTQEDGLTKSNGGRRSILGVEHFCRRYVEPYCRTHPDVRRDYATQMMTLARLHREAGSGWRDILRTTVEALRADPGKPLRSARRRLRQRRRGEA